MNKAELTEYITGTFQGPLEIIETEQPEPYFTIKREDLVSFARFLHDDLKLQMNFLMSLAAVHYAGERFEAVYNVFSCRMKHRLLFKILMDHEKPECDSVMLVWPAANWYEREMWELFGINVRNHPNLTRFLLPDDWDEGYPMRKGWTGDDFIVLPER